MGIMLDFLHPEEREPPRVRSLEERVTCLEAELRRSRAEIHRLSAAVERLSAVLPPGAMTTTAPLSDPG